MKLLCDVQRQCVWLFFALCTVLTSAASALASTEPEGFEDYTPPPVSDYQAPTFVLIAYISIWMLLMGYLVFLWRKQAQLRRDVEELQARLNAAEPRRS